MNQPFLHDQLVLVAAPTMAVCPRSGQLDGSGVGGLFTADRRVCSTLHVTVDGHEPESIHAELDGADAARFVGVLRYAGLPEPLRLERCRRIFDGAGAGAAATGEPGKPGLHETVTVWNPSRREVAVRLRLSVDTDLADIFSVNGGAPESTRTRTEPTPGGYDIACAELPGWRVRTVSDPVADPAPAPATEAPRGFDFDATVPAGGSTRVELTVTAQVPADAVVVRPGPRVLAARAPSVRSTDGLLAPLVARSVADLDHLLLADPLAPADAFFAAGAPWFLTLFGRDSLWAAWFALPLGVDLAASTLRTLARRQATEVAIDIAAEPGKILHELRPPAAPSDAGRWLPPLYYGSIDSTMLWIRLLREAWRWGLPAEQVRNLLPNLVAAAGWLTGYADADGDGLIEYIDASGHGLANQGWKDSHDSVQNVDATLATPPVALCEVQGYAYAAAQAAAELFAAFGLPGGDKLAAWAQRVKAAFHAKFWLTDEYGPYLALAVDGRKRPVTAVASNAGHILTSGLLDDEQVGQLARRLAAPELASGFGLRTMSDRSAGYNPIGYHTGSVWTHDTAIVAGELAATGHPDEAAALIDGLLAAAPAFGFRLPELYSGEAGSDVTQPAPYPAACRPQAWAAGSGLAIVTALLGIRPDVPAGELELVPIGLATGRLDGLAVAGLAVGGGRLSVRVRGADLEVVDTPPGLRVTVRG